MLAYGSEALAPVLRVASRALSRGSRTEPREWRRGLILGHTHIGDVLYRTCSLEALREGLPGCEWTYATSHESDGILANNPYLAESLPLIRGENSWNLERGGFDELASRRFDAVLCTNTLRHHPDIALACALRIPNRVAFTGKGFSGAINHQVPLGFPDSYAGYFRSMVAHVTRRPGDWPLRPRVYPTAADEARAMLLRDAFGLSASRPVVACSLRTRQAQGNWPEEILVALLKAARQQLEFDVVLTGSAADAGALKSLAGTLPFPAHVLAGEAKLLEFAAFLSHCTVLLALDSGPRHIGNAVGIPVLFARNLSHSKAEAGAYCAGEIDLAPDAEYLSAAETEAVARRQSVGKLANTLLETLAKR